jgi:hypothetical protein
MPGAPLPEDPSQLPEPARLRRLRRLVDTTSALLRQTDLTLGEALRLTELVRVEALRLFPDKADTYDLIYRPRFERLIRERFGDHV